MLFKCTSTTVAKKLTSVLRNYVKMCKKYKCKRKGKAVLMLNPLNAELNPICHLLTLLGAHHILHVSRIRVKNQPIRYVGEMEISLQASYT
jgi:hypothetical protein